MPDPTDILILGAGPTGLYAAFCAGMRGLSVTMVDSLPVLGGQLVTLYPEKRIFDVPGEPEILAADLADRLITQARRFAPEIRLNCTLQRWYHDKLSRSFAVHTSSGLMHARTLLLTGGIGSLSPRPLKLPGGSRYASSIHYWIEDPSRFAGQRVLVIGGSFPAVRWTLDLLPHAATVMLVHKRDHLHAPPEMIRRLRDSGAILCLDHEIVGLDGPERLEIAHLKCQADGSVTPILADALVAATGFVSSAAPLRDWSVKLQGSTIPVDATGRTSQPGVWAAGDIASCPNKLKLLVSNFAEAATAVNHIKVHLDPEARLFPGHSSDNPLLLTGESPGSESPG